MSDLLTSTAQVFSNWREEVHPNRYQSDALKEQALKCLEQHSVKVVSEALGISRKTLLNWSETQQSTTAEKRHETLNPPAIDFIPLEIHDQYHEQSKLNSSKLSIKLEIKLPKGISISLNPQALASSVAFIKALNEELI